MILEQLPEVQKLPDAQKRQLAEELWLATNAEDGTEQAWLAVATQRSAEMDADPDCEISHEEFLAGIEVKKARA